MFVVYHIKSTMQVATYKHEGRARTCCAKKNATQNFPCFAYAMQETYDTHVVHMVERTNLMSGKKFMEPSNTPLYLSPASETYWSS